MHNYRVPLIITLLFSSMLHLYCADTPSYLLVAEDGSSVMTSSAITERSEYFKKQLEDPYSPIFDGHGDGPFVVPVPVRDATELGMLKDILELGTKKEINNYIDDYIKSQDLEEGASLFTLALANLSERFAIIELEKFLGIAAAQGGVYFPEIKEIVKRKDSLSKKLVAGYHHLVALHESCVKVDIRLDIFRHPSLNPINAERLPTFITVRDFIEFNECTTGPLDVHHTEDYPLDTRVTEGLSLFLPTYPVNGPHKECTPGGGWID